MLMINTLHFSPAPLFHASVIQPSLVFNIPSPSLDSQLLPGPTKSTGRFLWGLSTTERLCHLADLARSLFSVLHCWEEVGDSYFLIASEIKGHVLTGHSTAMMHSWSPVGESLIQ